MRDEDLEGARILERLRLKNVAGKKNLIEDLKKRRNERSVSLLVEMLQDESWYLREQAVQALSEAGAEARDPVLQVLKDGLWFARASAAKVLGKIGDPSVAETLSDCVLDSNMTVQGAAAAALVDIARSSSVDDVASALASKPNDVKQKALACLSLLDKEIAEGIAACWDRAVAKGGSQRSRGEGKSEEERAEPSDGEGT